MKLSIQHKPYLKAGYTLVEVMMAMGIMAMGGVGIMGLHQASTKANNEARQISTANSVMRIWMERVKIDALGWTQSGASAAEADLSRTTYLSHQGEGWFLPGYTSDSEQEEEETPTDISTTTLVSFKFDHYGRDTETSNDVRFCTNMRSVWVIPGRALRVDMRIWWVRRGVNASNYANCLPTSDPDTLTNDPNLHMVFTSTVVRPSPPELGLSQ